MDKEKDGTEYSYILLQLSLMGDKNVKNNVLNAKFGRVSKVYPRYTHLKFDV